MAVALAGADAMLNYRTSISPWNTTISTAKGIRAMLSFDPPELQEQLATAMRKVEALLQDEYAFAGEAFNTAADEFDPNEYDDVVVKADDTFDLSLSRCDEAITISYKDFIRLADELEQSELERNLECWTPHRYYLRVEPMFWGYEGPFIPDGLGKTCQLGDKTFTCSVVSGYTPFGFLVAAEGDYDKYFPPVLAEDFHEVECDRSVEKEQLRAIAEAFRFEVRQQRPGPLP